MSVSKTALAKAEKCLVDNNVEQGEAKTVLQALGYILLDEELYWQRRVMTLGELAEFLAKSIDTDSFSDCDFAIVHSDAKDVDLERVRSEVFGWYGVKSVDTGFGGEALTLVSDYYGGGQAAIAQFFFDSNQKTVETQKKDIEIMLLKTLAYLESDVSRETLLYVELLKPLWE